MRPYSTSIFDTCKGCFTADLPAGLLPEHSMYYDIPKDSADAPPSQKLFKLGQGEPAELNRQILSLHTQPFPAAGKRLYSVQPKNSPYGSLALFVRRADGGLRMCIKYQDKQPLKYRSSSMLL